MKIKKRKLIKDYPNGGDGMFFFHKLTKHPAKQITHSNKTWTNRRYTHSPNRPKNYEIDEELSEDGEIVFYQKRLFIDKLFTRGKPYRMKKKKRH